MLQFFRYSNAATICPAFSTGVQNVYEEAQSRIVQYGRPVIKYTLKLRLHFSFSYFSDFLKTNEDVKMFWCLLHSFKIPNTSLIFHGCRSGSRSAFLRLTNLLSSWIFKKHVERFYHRQRYSYSEKAIYVLYIRIYFHICNENG